MRDTHWLDRVSPSLSQARLVCGFRNLIQRISTLIGHARAVGLMFAFSRNRFFGSYWVFSCTSRA